MSSYKFHRTKYFDKKRRREKKRGGGKGLDRTFTKILSQFCHNFARILPEFARILPEYHPYLARINVDTLAKFLGGTVPPPPPPPSHMPMTIIGLISLWNSGGNKQITYIVG